MSYAFNSRYATTSSTTTVDVSKDVELANPADDSISSVSWSSAANILATSSWDQKVRIYSLNNNPIGEPMALMSFDGPVLDSSWSPDGHKVVGASTDKTARLLDLQANGAAAQQVAAHDASISSIRFFEGPSNAAMVVTGSWDKTVKYWDLRSERPAATVDVKDKVYSMDVRKKHLVVATAGSRFCKIDLQNPTTIADYPQLAGVKGETRVVKCFPDGEGFIVGCAGGKCSAHWFNANLAAKNFSFKCHRAVDENKNQNCYPVNAIAFHPGQGTLCTGGADGVITIWDMAARNRLGAFPSAGTPITSLAFNQTGEMLAYAVSYDWNKGYAFNTPQTVKKIMIHPVSPQEVKVKSTR